MTKTVVTAADVAANYDDYFSSFSDLYKDLNNVRPRWAATPEEIAHFFNTYDEQFERAMEDERRELAAISERYGQEFKSWTEYFDFKDALERKEWLADQAKHAAEQKLKAEMSRMGSPLPVIEAWMHGQSITF